MKRNLLLGRILSLMIFGFFFYTALSQGDMTSRKTYQQRSEVNHHDDLPKLPLKSDSKRWTEVNYYDEPPLQGYVRQITQTVYRAVVYHGIIGKDSIIIQTGDTLQFNPDGTPNKKKIVFSVNHPTDSIVFLFDKEGRCLKQTTYYPNGQLKESRSYMYNSAGKIKLCIIRDASEETVDAISYSYDPYGKLAIKIINRKEGNMRQQRFAYDSHGNWVIRVDFKEYEPVYFVERTILYY